MFFELIKVGSWGFVGCTVRFSLSLVRRHAYPNNQPRYGATNTNYRNLMEPTFSHVAAKHVNIIIIIIQFLYSANSRMADRWAVQEIY